MPLHSPLYAVQVLDLSKITIKSLNVFAAKNVDAIPSANDQFDLV